LPIFAFNHLSQRKFSNLQIYKFHNKENKKPMSFDRLLLSLPVLPKRKQKKKKKKKKEKRKKNEGVLVTVRRGD
jgi:hypothetical protein